MLLPLLAGLVFSPAQAAQQAPATISFDEPAAPLSRILADLSKATNLPLKLSKAMPDYVIDISVRDVSVKDLMQKVADATAGIWDESEHSFFLTPSDGARAKITAEAQKARATAIAASLKKMADYKPPTDPTKFDASAYVYGFTGNDEFFSKTLAAIGPERLSSLVAADRVVMSTKPLGRQLDFPVNTDLVSAYVTRHNAQAVEQAAAAKAEQAKTNGGVATGDEGGDQTDTVSTIGAWSKADLVVSRASGAFDFISSGGITCQLTLYDNKGEIIDSDSANLPVGDASIMIQMMEEVAPGAAKTKKPDPGPAEKEIELSPNTRLFLQVALEGQGEGPSFMKKLPKPTAEEKAAVVARNLRPDQFEPLAYAGDLITGMAKIKNEQLVACLPDSAFMYVLYSIMGRSTPTVVEKQLLADEDLVCHQKDGWLTITPADFRITPMDRVALSRTCNDLSNGVSPTLEWRSQAAMAGVGDFFRGPLGMIWLSIFAQGNDEVRSSVNASLLMGTTDWNTLHLYGELDDNQKATLLRDKRLMISTLSDSARSLVDRMIYSAQEDWSARLSVEVKPNKDSLFGPTEQIFEDQSQDLFDGEPANDYRSEPTEVAPNGLPDEAAITVKVSDSTVLVPVMEKKAGANGQIYQMGMSPEELGGYLGMMESPNFMATTNGRYTPPKIVGVKLTAKRTLHFRIWVARDTFRSSTVDEYAPGADQIYSLTNMPPDIQAKVDKAKAKSIEMYKNYKGTRADGAAAAGSGGGVPR